VQNTPSESTNDGKELIFDFGLVNLIPSFDLLFRIFLMKLSASVFEFNESASFSNNTAELIDIFLFFARTAHCQSLLIDHVPLEGYIL